MRLRTYRRGLAPPRRSRATKIAVVLATFLLAFLLVLGAFPQVSTAAVFLTSTVASVAAALGVATTTPPVPMELPVEVEIELAPAASLKQAPLWKELVQLLQNPSLAPATGTASGPSGVVRRPAFRQPGDPRGQNLPALNVWPLGYNFLTAQPLRLRTSDGEISWDQPGPLFDPAEVVPVNAFNVPTALRTPVGQLVVRINGVGGFSNPACPDPGCLVVSNPGRNRSIPPNGTIVAVPAVINGVLNEYDPATGERTPITALDTPINEIDFLRAAADATGIPAPLLGLPRGRDAAEVLGKALFWDMQVGSDGVQACGTCHFAAGADNRTRNQLNPDHLGGDLTLQVKGPNQDVVAADFPFHKLVSPDIVGEPLLNPGNVASDKNDVMSSMGVKFRQFVDIPPIGAGSFGSAVNGVQPLLPDIGTVVVDPIAAAFVDPATGQNLRRVEPRNTPTMHSAAFNLDNFWDGRARFHFNGGSVFGAADPQAHIFLDRGRPGPQDGPLHGATNGDLRPALVDEGDPKADQPVRISFSSLASQAAGPPLSEFEMSFLGRNWPKIGKKLLQAGVTPLANQLVATTDSRLGLFSNQGGAVCAALGRPTAANKPGLCVSYPEMIQLAFKPEFWHNTGQHLNGAPGADPFDGYVLTLANGAADAANRNQFNQMEANFSLFFGLAAQTYEQLLIPDDTPFDRFMDANPLAANGIGQPGEQAVLFPTLIPGLVGGSLTLIADDPATPEYDGFNEEELFGFDIFAGGNLTAALPPGSARNPAGLGANPFTRNARCMLCHLGPEQTDHSINIAHGLLKGDAEFEFPTPPSTGIAYTGPGGNTAGVPIPPPSIIIPSAEPPGPIAVVPGMILAEEIAGTAQDAVEVEPRSFAMVDDPATPWDDRVVAQPRFFAFGDQGIYNLGLRPIPEDVGRGGNDAFGLPLSLSALALKNIGGASFQPCDLPTDSCVMGNVDPLNLGATFEETGEGLFFPGTRYTLQSINPGFEKTPSNPQLPPYLAPWTNELPAGELHPQIDELAFAPNTKTPPTGGPALEFGEAMFCADLHCGLYNPALFGSGPPNFGWGPTLPLAPGAPNPCPNNQSGVTGNFDVVLHGTWPVPNRVLRNGAFKAPQLRNVELTGPYFHTGSYLTLRQVVDFYMRGGDFPLTNGEARDPSILNVGEQAFGFGRTAGPGLGVVNVTVNGVTYNGNLADALPDTVYRYDAMPDTDHPLTPEPATSTPEAAKVALVKFLLSLTDPRVKYERAPFDRPELFVPVDGRAPDNTLGRPDLVSLSTGLSPMFRQIPAVGAAGNATPLPSFLGISSIPVPGPNNDHFDR